MYIINFLVVGITEMKVWKTVDFAQNIRVACVVEQYTQWEEHQISSTQQFWGIHYAQDIW